MHIPSQSGRSLARLVTDPQLKDVSGKYFVGTQREASSEESYHNNKALDLWQTSVALTGLTKDESVIGVGPED